MVTQIAELAQTSALSKQLVDRQHSTTEHIPAPAIALAPVYTPTVITKLA